MNPGEAEDAGFTLMTQHVGLGMSQGANPLTTDCLETRRPHYVAEKRYRAKLNENLALLACYLPEEPELTSEGASVAGNGDNDPNNDKTWKQRPTKRSKGAVLERAVDYIQQLERKNEAQKRQALELQIRIEAATTALA